MFDTLERRPLFTILVHKIRGAAAAQEFVELSRVPAVGDCLTTSEGLFQVRLVVLHTFHGDVAAEAYSRPVALESAFGPA